MAPVKLAKVIEVGLEAEPTKIVFPYRIDDEFKDALEIELPFTLSPEEREVLLPPVALGAAVFLAQFCLARTIICRFPCNDDLVAAMLPIAELLYDVRCFKDSIPLEVPPAFHLTRAYQPHRFTVPEAKRACQLWSGGVDSTFCTVVLKGNGYALSPVHFTANTHTVLHEQQAVERLSRLLGVGPVRVGLSFPQQLPIGKRYSNAFDTYPHENAIPFGRELLLLLLATLLAKKEGCPYVCVGADYDGRHRRLYYQGKAIYRHDMEAAYACDLLQRFIERFISPSLRLMPPLAQLTKYRILYEMFMHYPHLVCQSSFCFWGKPCGRCFKCVMYYTVQRALRIDAVQFEANPILENNQELRIYISQWDNKDLLCPTAMHYCLSRIVERGDIREGEALLERYRTQVYPHFQGKLASMEEELMRVYEDPIIPREFHVI